jgi:PHP family Zn ribbon phosphoesterase
MSGASEPSGASAGAAQPPAAAEMSVRTAFAGMRRVAEVVFKAGCPDCRARFELGASALRLAIGATSKTTFYSFTCPECGASVRKPAGERIVELLTGGGVRTLRLHSTL